MYRRGGVSISKPPGQFERLGYSPSQLFYTNQIRKMKLINVIFILMAIAMTWLTSAKVEDKIFMTIFFTIAIGFWLMAMHDDKKRVA